MVENQGFEPRMPEATDLQSAEVTNASRSPAGSPRWVRTTDLRINSPSLYRLSYQGIICLVPTIGFELMTYRLQGDCTTTVLSRLIGRSTRIRTLDPLVPNQMRYQAALHSVVWWR